MIYLLDTNIISETVRRDPCKNVMSWLKHIPNYQLAISVLTIGEIRKGAEKAPDPKRKAKLIQWLEIDLHDWFSPRILEVDERVADKWGYLCAKSPAPLPIIDSLLAATALCYGLTLVTRNTKDFELINGLEILNPFDL